ncbi:hypothetical protein [Streptomyces sp. NPDC002057]|uniref:hypothetical protein n=1 Tax=Streptomyces sp. NPDC002057 TaxID=3154664 RepID=UPI00331B7E5E
MGTRARADVELARKRLGAGAAGPGDPSPQFRGGAAAALSWALGGAERAPVTGSGAGQEVPDLQTLTAEVDAAVVQAEDPTSPLGPREYNRGVHAALAWVCGHSDDAP